MDRNVRYRVLVGISYRAHGGQLRRAEPGELVDDIPARDVEWMLRDGVIEKAGEPRRKVD